MAVKKHWHHFCSKRENFFMQFIFTIDKNIVTEGDTVEIRWDCSGAEKTFLTIDNGFKSTRLEIENSGSKKFRLNRSRGKTGLTLEAVENGKTTRKRLGVKVKKLRTTRTQTVNNEEFRRQREEFARKPFREKWTLIKAAARSAWQYMPEKKRSAYKILGVLLLVLLLVSISPIILSIGILALAIYLVSIILKK